jgi:hypothetical protein
MVGPKIAAAAAQRALEVLAEEDAAAAEALAGDLALAQDGGNGGAAGGLQQPKQEGTNGGTNGADGVSGVGRLSWGYRGQAVQLCYTVADVPNRFVL